MKATLTFNLPEEQDEHQQALNAGKVLGAIQEFDNFLRAKLKYEELTEADQITYSYVREKLYNCFSDSGIKIWE